MRPEGLAARVCHHNMVLTKSGEQDEWLGCSGQVAAVKDGGVAREILSVQPGTA